MARKKKTPETTLDNEVTQKIFDKIFDYIVTLEKTNNELVHALKNCVQLLIQLKASVSNPQKLQEMIDLFHEIIQTAEKTIEKKAIH